MSSKRATAAAQHALEVGRPRHELGPEAQAEYDRLAAEAGIDLTTIGPSQAPASTRTSPEIRARILQMFKQANPKYARPFEGNRLSAVSLLGTESWSEYGQVVLQMAILDTLLSIEELLSRNNDEGARRDRAG
jgi:hypothetical protein